MEGIHLITLNMIKESGLSEEEKKQFDFEFEKRRKSETTALILTALGCIGIGGIGRFYLGHKGMGILYLITFGVFWIGTLYDLIKLKDLVQETNHKIAMQILQEIKYMRK